MTFRAGVAYGMNEQGANNQYPATPAAQRHRGGRFQGATFKQGLVFGIDLVHLDGDVAIAGAGYATGCRRIRFCLLQDKQRGAPTIPISIKLIGLKSLLEKVLSEK